MMLMKEMHILKVSQFNNTWPEKLDQKLEDISF